MNPTLRLRLTILFLCVWVVVAAKPAQAQYGDIGASRGQITAVVVGIIAVGAAIGVGAYFLVRRAPTLTGCADSATSGLSLQNEGDHQTYSLIGDVGAIKAGDRIRVSGKKKKKDASGKRDFLVEKLSKDLGACKVPSATP